MQFSSYIYNAGGERVWKLAGTETQMQLNAQLTISSVGFDKTLYHSPLMVMTDQEYTKHYFIEGERVCSKTCAEPCRVIGGGFGSNVPDICGQHLSFIHGDEISVAADFETTLRKGVIWC